MERNGASEIREVTQCARKDVGKVVRLVLVNDHPVVREGLLQVLQDYPEFTVCAYAIDPAAAVEVIALHRPDIAIVDLTLPEGSGIDLVRSLHHSDPDLRILVLSAQDEVIYANQVLAAGANGYLMKDAPAIEVISALKLIGDGGTYLSDAAVARVTRLAYCHKIGSLRHSGSLSAREHAVLALLTEGLTPSVIAERLDINVKTVYAHLENSRQKLGLDSSSEMTRYALLLRSQAS
jgi:DNA-binding NarL/FixJ family response regulator